MVARTLKKQNRYWIVAAIDSAGTDGYIGRSPQESRSRQTGNGPSRPTASFYWKSSSRIEPAPPKGREMSRRFGIVGQARA